MKIFANFGKLAEIHFKAPVLKAMSIERDQRGYNSQRFQTFSMAVFATKICPEEAIMSRLCRAHVARSFRQRLGSPENKRKFSRPKFLRKQWKFLVISSQVIVFVQEFLAGREDSNLRMGESKSPALPHGDAPIEPITKFDHGRPLA
jgi:hypothetical protein